MFRNPLKMHAYSVFIFAVLVNFNSVKSNAVYGKNSLTFVIDDTASMHEDIKQAKEASHAILDIAIRSESSQIENFILVTFNDPGRW